MTCTGEMISNVLQLQVDTAPRLSISIVIWILSSDTDTHYLSAQPIQYKEWGVNAVYTRPLSVPFQFCTLNLGSRIMMQKSLWRRKNGRVGKIRNITFTDFSLGMTLPTWMIALNCGAMNVWNILQILITNKGMVLNSVHCKANLWFSFTQAEAPPRRTSWLSPEILMFPFFFSLAREYE